MTWIGNGSGSCDNSLLTWVSLVRRWRRYRVCFFMLSVRPAVTARRAVTDGYERRQMMEIRNKLVNWRRRRLRRSADRVSGIIYTLAGLRAS